MIKDSIWHAPRKETPQEPLEKQLWSAADKLMRGMLYLVEKLGTVDAEHFIAAILREHFDCTQWQRTRFDDEDLESLNAAATAWATEYEANHDMK